VFPGGILYTLPFNMDNLTTLPSLGSVKHCCLQTLFALPCLVATVRGLLVVFILLYLTIVVLVLL
jgi:hypothetical protein